MEPPDGLTMRIVARMRFVRCAGVILTSGTHEATLLSEGKEPSIVPWLVWTRRSLSEGEGPGGSEKLVPTDRGTP